MTTREESRKRAKRIKELALQGYSIQLIAKRLRKSPSTIRSVLETLRHKGEIVIIRGTSPLQFRDPHAHPIKKLVNDDPEVEKFDEPIQDYLPEGMELPQGYVNCHIAGYVSATVRQKGEFVTVYRDGEPVVVWDEPKPSGKGLTMWTCHMRFFGQDLKVNYYEGAKGARYCRLYLNRIYVDPSKVDRQRRYDYFMERAEYLVKVLHAKGGWQITDLQMKGKFHYGKENDPLSFFIPKDANTDDTDITTDTSPGVVESEMENIDGLPEDEGEELVKIYANIPSELLKQRTAIEANSSDISKLIASNHAQQALLTELQTTVNLQSTIISGLTENLTKLTEATVQLTTMGMAQVQRDTVKKTDLRLEGYL